MKFFTARINKDKRDGIHIMNPTTVVAETEEEAIASYKDLKSNLTEDEITDTEIICKPVDRGMVQLSIEVEKFKACYPEDVQVISVLDKKRGVHLTGFKVAIIPAKVFPTQEDILEYYYRGNLVRYKSDLKKAETDPEVRKRLRILRQAMPWDRLVLDVGYKNDVIPMTDDFVIE